MANGFIFKCSLDPNIQEPLFAYRLGQYRQDWLSLDARSLSDLAYDTVSRSKVVDPKTKKRKNLLLIVVANDSKLMRWFEMLKKPDHGFEKLRIHFYPGVNQNQSGETTTFVFYNFKQSGKPEGHKPGLLFTFEYNDMEVFGPQA